MVFLDKSSACYWCKYIWNEKITKIRDSFKPSGPSHVESARSLD